MIDGSFLVGIAAIVTAVSMFIQNWRSNAKVLEKTEEIHVLTNSGQQSLQASLDTANATIAEMSRAAAAIAADLAVSTEADAEQRRERDRTNRSHLSKP